MRLGFDIDDTLINLREHAFHIYNQKLNKNIPVDTFYQIKRLEIHEPFGLTDDEGKQMWIDSLEEIYFTECPVYPDAVETLQELEKDGHEIFYITARPKEHGERTKQWMKKNGFPVSDERFFYGMLDEEKINIIKELKLDYYFDDKPEVLTTLLNESVKVYVRDQLYNQHVDLPRIKSWNELTNILKQYQ